MIIRLLLNLLRWLFGIEGWKPIPRTTRLKKVPCFCNSCKPINRHRGIVHLNQPRRADGRRMRHV